MAQSFESLGAILNHGFDGLVDVRSPAEYAIDHIPGAINLPALSDDERAEVGTMYTQVSPFLARKLGAALVLRNIAAHVEGSLKDIDGSWQPLVYCWRGGQRSGVFGTLLREIGWRAETIQGGYQSYRQLVNAYLYQDQLPHRFILLDGYTGTAKTEILPRLASKGVQTIDLEGLAGHRGSLLGAMPGGQPAQRGFETGLAQQLIALDPTRPTVLEAESSKIGAINLPPSLWSGMVAAPRIRLSAPQDARIAYIAKAYADILRDPETVRTRLEPLRHLRGHAVVNHWKTLQEAKNYNGLAASLMQDHYDPAYAKSRARNTDTPMAEITAQSLDDAGQEAAATQIAALINRLA